MPISKIFINKLSFLKSNRKKAIKEGKGNATNHVLPYSSMPQRNLSSCTIQLH